MRCSDEDDNFEKLFEHATKLINEEYLNKLKDTISSRTRRKKQLQPPLSANSQSRVTKAAQRELRKEWNVLKKKELVAEEKKKSKSPKHSEILLGVVAYVEVDCPPRKASIEKLLQNLGATVNPKFTHEVTHIIFKNGCFDTIKRAKLLNVHLVSVLWIEACKNSRKRVPEKLFPVVDSKDYTGSPRVFRRFMERGMKENNNFLDKTTKRLMLIEANGPDAILSSDESSESVSSRVTEVLSPISTNISRKSIQKLVETINLSTDSEKTPLEDTTKKSPKRISVASNTPIETLIISTDSEKTPVDDTTKKSNTAAHDSKLSSNTSKESFYTSKGSINSSSTTFHDVSKSSINNSKSSNKHSNTSNEIKDDSGRSEQSKNDSNDLVLRVSTDDSLNETSITKNINDLVGNLSVITEDESSKSNSNENDIQNIMKTSKKQSQRSPSINGSTYCRKNSRSLNESANFITLRRGYRNNDSSYGDLSNSLNIDRNNEKTDKDVNMKEEVDFKSARNKCKRKLFNKNDTNFDISNESPAICLNPYVEAGKENVRKPRKNIVNVRKRKKVTQKSNATKLTDTPENTSQSDTQDNTSQSDTDCSNLSTDISDKEPNLLVERKKTKKRNVFKKKANEWDKDRKKREKDRNKANEWDKDRTKREKDRNKVTTRSVVERLPPTFLRTQSSVEYVIHHPSLVGTYMHRPENTFLKEAVEKLGRFKLRASVASDTTHIVTGAPVATINLLKALAKGCWILHKSWVEESVEAGRWLREQDYELTEFSAAVVKNRIDRTAIGNDFTIDIFKDSGNIYIAKNTTPDTKDLKSLIKLCKGRVVDDSANANVVIGTYIKGRKCVNEQWVIRSVRDGRLKRFKEFLLSGN